MAKEHKFRARIKSNNDNGGGSGAWVDVSFDVEKAFGKKRVPIRATIDGEPYRGSLVRMGSDCHMLLVRKAIRQKIGKKTGDIVTVTLREDTASRTVKLPADVSRALNPQPAAGKFFDDLSFTHQREYIEWINDAKQAETRQRRIGQMLELLARKKKERH